MFNLKTAEMRAMLGASPSRKADHAPPSKTIVFDGFRVLSCVRSGGRIYGGDER